MKSRNPIGLASLYDLRFQRSLVLDGRYALDRDRLAKLGFRSQTMQKHLTQIEAINKSTERVSLGTSTQNRARQQADAR
jgi:hypothetical protein